MASITPTSIVQQTGDVVGPASAPPQLPTESDFLENIRKRNPSIPADFFSSDEEILIRSMFQETTLCFSESH
jgi:hypothetical protein